MKIVDLIAVLILTAVVLFFLNRPDSPPSNAIIRASENEEALRLIASFPKVLEPFAPAARAGTLNHAQFSQIKLAAEAETERKAEIEKNEWRNSMREEGVTGALLVWLDGNMFAVGTFIFLLVFSAAVLRFLPLQR